MILSGHSETMKHAKVSELKARLSSYLAEVGKGDTLGVCARSIPIARLVPMEEEGFTIREYAKPISELKAIQPVKLRKKVDIIKILREIRGNR
jgi:antitoxin (DNA-binding transcriptional repressor) of toxin-antitoxin stability system